MVILKIVGVFFVCILLVYIAATGSPVLRFISILVIVVLAIVFVAVMEHRDDKIKLQYDESFSSQLRYYSKKRKQYRSYMPNIRKTIIS